LKFVQNFCAVLLRKPELKSSTDIPFYGIKSCYINFSGIILMLSVSNLFLVLENLCVCCSAHAADACQEIIKY